MAGPSLSDLKKQPEQQKQAEAQSFKPSRNASYSDEQVNESWKQFMAMHPKEQVLVNTMRASTPLRIQGDTFRIVVENHVQTQLMANTMPNLITFMRDRLGNDFFKIEIEENHDAGSPHTWNDRELLAHIVTENPAIHHLIESFKLRL